MSRGRINHERWVQHYLDRWIYLMALGKWRITWEVLDVVREDSGLIVEARNETDFKRKTQHIQFNRRLLRTKKAIEIAVTHELLHQQGRGARGRDEHLIINRLDGILRIIRIRASRYVYT